MQRVWEVRSDQQGGGTAQRQPVLRLRRAGRPQKWQVHELRSIGNCPSRGLGEILRHGSFSRAGQIQGLIG